MLDGVRGGADAGGVDQAQRQAAQVDDLLDGIARGAGRRADDRAVVAEEEVEQARFADIRRAVDDGAHTLPEDLAARGGGEQRLEIAAQFSEARVQGVAGFGRDVLIGKIDVGLDVREELEDALLQRRDAPAERAGELLVRGAQREIGLRGDEVHHGLGLREVELAVEERALRELAGLRQPRAGLQQEIEQAPRDQQAAMSGKLDHVLARVARRRGEMREQNLVDFVVAVVDRAEFRAPQLPRAAAAKEPRNDRRGLGSADADERDGALADGRGDRGDRVGGAHILSHESHASHYSQGRNGKHGKNVSHERRQLGEEALVLLGGADGDANPLRQAV